MGTPTVIHFKGDDNYGQPKSVSLYRHYDGDPVTQLRDLYTVIRKAATMAHEYASEFPNIVHQAIITPSTLTGLYIGETTGTHGMIASVISNPDDSYGEYLYSVDIDAKTITVADEDGTPLDPFSYIDRLVDDAQASHRGSLEESIEMLGDMGFSVLPGEKAER